MISISVMIRASLGVIFGLVLLYLAARNFDLAEMSAAAYSARLSWILLGMGLYAVDVLVRIERWRRLIRPTLQLPYPAVAEALLVGYAMNNLLPARLGELFRADFISRRHNLARSAAVGSIMIERMMDVLMVVGIFVLGLVAISSARASAPHALIMVAVLAIGGLVVGAAGIAAIVKWHSRLPDRFEWVNARVALLAGSISALTSADLRRLLLLSVVIWLFEAAAIGCMVLAFGVDLRLAGLCVLVGACSLSALLPSAPGYLGSLQIAFVAAFSAIGAAEPLGLLSATATQIFLLGSVSIIGVTLLVASRFYTSGYAYVSQGAVTPLSSRQQIAR